MNLILSRNCANSCPYCFDEAERQGKQQHFISMENVERFARWAYNARLGYLSLSGGEPFLHPKLGTIVKFFRQALPGTSLRILSGGMFNNDLFDSVPYQDTSIVFNINEPRDYTKPKHFNKVINNIETATRKGFKVGIGFNVWRLDFDPTFIPRLAHQLGISRITWAVANPERGKESDKAVPPQQWGELSERCLDMLKEAARLNIDASLDCSLPLCFFKDSDLGWVRQYHPGTAALIGVCEPPPIDVTPELEVIRCFACSKVARLKLMDFRCQEDIEYWFVNHLDTQLLQQGCFPYCSECPHLKSGRCYGGCLAWHAGDVDIKKDESSAADLEQKMNEALESGKPDLALSYYKTANRWLRTDAVTLIAAVAASKLGEWEQALRYATDAYYRAYEFETMKKIVELIKSIPASTVREFEDIPKDETFTQFVSLPVRQGDEN